MHNYLLEINIFFLTPLFLMGKQPYPFRPYFELATNPDNKANKYAVKNTQKECHVTNRAKLCYDHLASCENLKNDIVKKNVKKFLH